MGKDEIKKKESKEKKEQAFFVQRLVAFLIDVLLISLIASVISTPFVNTDKTVELEKQVTELVKQIQKEDINVTEYTTKYMNIYYKLARNSGVSSFIVIFLNVLYFVVYQIYKKGQTIGKKLVNIRVISDDGDLTYNQMIFRSFIANFILVDLLMFAFMIFSSKDIYFWATIIFQGIQYLIVFASVIMILNHNDGRAIHDKIVHTRVIREK